MIDNEVFASGNLTNLTWMTVFLVQKEFFCNLFELEYCSWIIPWIIFNYANKTNIWYAANVIMLISKSKDAQKQKH